MTDRSQVCLVSLQVELQERVLQVGLTVIDVQFDLVGPVFPLERELQTVVRQGRHQTCVLVNDLQREQQRLDQGLSPLCECGRTKTQKKVGFVRGGVFARVNDGKRERFGEFAER